MNHFYHVDSNQSKVFFLNKKLRNFLKYDLSQSGFLVYHKHLHKHIEGIFAPDSYLVFHVSVAMQPLLDLLNGSLLERVGFGDQLAQVVVHGTEEVVAENRQPEEKVRETSF